MITSLGLMQRACRHLGWGFSFNMTQVLWCGGDERQFTMSPRSWFWFLINRGPLVHLRKNPEFLSRWGDWQRPGVVRSGRSMQGQMIGVWSLAAGSAQQDQEATVNPTQQSPVQRDGLSRHTMRIECLPLSPRVYRHYLGKEKKKDDSSKGYLSQGTDLSWRKFL